MKKGCGPSREQKSRLSILSLGSNTRREVRRFNHVQRWRPGGVGRDKLTLLYELIDGKCNFVITT